jgi:hypothetical protein
MDTGRRIMIRAGYFLVAIVSIVASFPVWAQTPADPNPCARDQDACNIVGRDAAAASSPGGIGSKKGTGGGGTNALRPDVPGNITVPIPTAPRLPNLPRRFGF